ncbi:hypothetical protein Tco_0655260 [Tanacetum coccineum]|uniref:Uncharacterized protein n=1 Tax=Tanacetum coccineum TaxID=301880 RepID=A0ABQ4X5I9_9ASTR
MQLTHYRLNIEDHEHPIITTIQIPQRGMNFLESYGYMDLMLILIQIPHLLHMEGKLFESHGCLLLVCRDDIGSSGFTIYEMMKGCSVWSVRYRVDTDDFMTPLPEGWLIQSTVWSIILGEREEDSFLMINLSGKNVETASGFPSDTVRGEWRRRHHDMQRRHDSRQEESHRTFDGLTTSGNHSTLHRRIVKLLEVLQDTAINDNHDDDDELLQHFKAEHNVYEFIPSFARV